jgi:hypothetical protein
MSKFADESTEFMLPPVIKTMEEPSEELFRPTPDNAADEGDTTQLDSLFAVLQALSQLASMDTRYNQTTKTLIFELQQQIEAFHTDKRFGPIIVSLTESIQRLHSHNKLLHQESEHLTEELQATQLLLANTEQQTKQTRLTCQVLTLQHQQLKDKLHRTASQKKALVRHVQRQERKQKELIMLNTQFQMQTHIRILNRSRSDTDTSSMTEEERQDRCDRKETCKDNDTESTLSTDEDDIRSVCSASGTCSERSLPRSPPVLRISIDGADDDLIAQHAQDIQQSDDLSGSIRSVSSPLGFLKRRVAKNPHVRESPDSKSTKSDDTTSTDSNGEGFGSFLSFWSKKDDSLADAFL